MMVFFECKSTLEKKALLNLIDPSHICSETIAQINELLNLGIKNISFRFSWPYS